MIVFQIICIILNLTIAFVLHNSVYVGYYRDKTPIPFKLPLIVWILWGIGCLIPILSAVLFFGIGLWITVNWQDCYQIEWPKDHWLFKKY